MGVRQHGDTVTKRDEGPDAFGDDQAFPAPWRPEAPPDGGDLELEREGGGSPADRFRCSARPRGWDGLASMSSRGRTQRLGTRWHTSARRRCSAIGSRATRPRSSARIGPPGRVRLPRNGLRGGEARKAGVARGSVGRGLERPPRTRVQAIRGARRDGRAARREPTPAGEAVAQAPFAG